MIALCAEYIVGFLCKNDIITDEEKNIYQYGFEIGISNLVNVFIAIMLGLIFSQLVSILIFLCVFSVMRKYSGGYHADTYEKCELIFALNVIGIIYILKLGIYFSKIQCLCISVLSILILVILAPIENKHKPLDINNCRKYKLYAIGLCILFSIISILIYDRSTQYSETIYLTLLSVVFSMIVQILKREAGEKNDEQC